MPTKYPIRQDGFAAKRQVEDQPRGRARGRGSALKDTRLAGYLAQAYCQICKLTTRHLVLRHQLECKRCLTVRRRRDGDPAPP